MQNYNSKFKSDLKGRCYKFSLAIIQLLNTLPKNMASNTIANQLVRSATSIGANLVEASASSSRLEYKKFFEISLKSANETKYWLSLLQDSGFSDEKVVSPLLNEVTELSKMLAVGILRLKGKL